MKLFFKICQKLVKPGAIVRVIFFSFLVICVGVAEATKADSPKDFQSNDPEEQSFSPADKIASESSSGGHKVDLTKRVTLDLRNMNVIDALKYIGLRSGMNIVTSKDVSGTVSFQIKDIPISDVLDITLLTNNLAYEKIGELYYIMTEKEYKERFGKAFSDSRQVKVFHLKYAIPQKAFDLLDSLKSSLGRILVDQESATVMIMDTPEKIKLMEEALQKLEEKNQIQVFDLQYASAKDVQEQLKIQIDDKGLGITRADTRTNQVVVQTLPNRMHDITDMIKSLDKKTKEVLIDAKIIKITLTDTLAKEFNWEGMFTQLTSGGGFLGNHPYSPIFRAGQGFIDDFTEIEATDANVAAGTKKTLTEEIYLGRVSSHISYEVLINFLQTLGNTKVISNPRLAVVNNQEAKIHIGRKEAYVTSTTTTGQTTSTTAEQVTFIDVGIQLVVTPTINEDGYITMKVKPEISSVVDTLVTPSGNEIPIVDTSTAETTVMVKDKSTIIIGGLRREDEVTTNKSIPGLNRIPLLGALFSSKHTYKERSELLVMITPRIIEGDVLVSGDELDQKGETKAFKDYPPSDDLNAPGKVVPVMGDEKSPLQMKNYRTYEDKEYIPAEVPAERWDQELNLKSYRN